MDAEQTTPAPEAQQRPAPAYEVEVDRIEVTAIIAVRRFGRKVTEVRYDPVLLFAEFDPKLRALLEKCQEDTAKQMAQALEREAGQ